MAAPKDAKVYPSIGPYRRIRLKPAPNAFGYYEVCWSDARFDYRTKTASCATKIYSEAQAFYRRFLDDARAEEDAAALNPAGRTIASLCDAWLDHALRAGKHRSLSYIVARVKTAFGHLTVAQLDRAVMLQHDTEARAKGLSPGTIRRELGCLQTILNWARDNNLIPPDAVPSFKKILPAGGPPRDKFMDPDQEQWFWDQACAWHQPHVRLFAAIGLETAHRREAILELEWDRVDLRRGLIDFRKPGRPETKKRRHKGLPISRRLRPILEDAAKRAPCKDGMGRPVGRLFPGITVPGLDRAFRRFTGAIGVAWVTPHVLRHTWGSLAAMANVPLGTISAFMCDDIKTVIANYMHLTPGHLEQAANFKDPKPQIKAVV